MLANLIIYFICFAMLFTVFLWRIRANKYWVKAFPKLSVEPNWELVDKNTWHYKMLLFFYDDKLEFLKFKNFNYTAYVSYVLVCLAQVLCLGYAVAAYAKYVTYTGIWNLDIVALLGWVLLTRIIIKLFTLLVEKTKKISERFKG